MKPPQARALIEHLGGPAKVSQMTKAPVTTVHSWMRVGLSDARLDHILLAAAREGLPVESFVPADEKAAA